MTDTRFHEMSDGRRIAFRLVQGSGPTLVFLPGYMSDMSGGKATAIFENAKAKERGCLLLDYSGCGESSGDFADGTLSRWREEVLTLIEGYVEGPVLVTGSSMGGWLVLLVGEALEDRLAGIIGVASAPDFTWWGYSEEQRAQLARGEVVLEDNPYGPEPTPTHPGFFTDAEAQYRLVDESPIDAPIRLIHGQRDADVPWEVSLKLSAALRSDDVQVTLIKDGDHRLSRESDIAQLLAVVDSFY
ncbi:alpha/beta hydrolase [uncultured Erythrobacter sp.]|uniref:alpha/beta fold hydrolase n=1 Tax=uncultured Erythrobacter sp. TaxID=263913 RepID=UPI00260790C2|nr:alpha/beta hydrolase [uncultured Erythrobacter sp.]